MTRFSAPNPLHAVRRLWSGAASASWHVAHFERVLGTSLEVRIRTVRPEQARVAQDALFAELDRLEAVFSRFDSASELNRWQTTAGEGAVSGDLAWLLREGLRWQLETGGAFHPGADALGQVWQGAGAAGRLPGDADLAPIVAQLRPPAYSVSETEPTVWRLGTLPLNFNALAKGRIVDLVGQAAQAVDGVREVLVNVGGDVRHLGRGDANCGHVKVAVADPFSAADNAPPLTRLRVRGQGVASSGRSKRGYRVGGRWFSHVLDPRTGWPAEAVVGASVIAPDCATADVLATAMSVLSPHESLALAGGLPGVGCLLVTREGDRLSNAFWRKHEL